LFTQLYWPIAINSKGGSFSSDFIETHDEGEGTGLCSGAGSRDRRCTPLPVYGIACAKRLAQTQMWFAAPGLEAPGGASSSAQAIYAAAWKEACAYVISDKVPLLCIQASDIVHFSLFLGCLHANTQPPAGPPSWVSWWRVRSGLLRVHLVHCVDLLLLLLLAPRRYCVTDRRTIGGASVESSGSSLLSDYNAYLPPGTFRLVRGRQR
jgi:hypothetical protein